MSKERIYAPKEKKRSTTQPWQKPLPKGRTFKHPVQALPDLSNVSTEELFAKLCTSHPGSRVEREAEQVIATKMNNNAANIDLDRETEQELRSLGTGRPLSEQERKFFEQRFSADFSGVRVHDNSFAHEIAAKLNARALTFGKDIVFGRGEYAPGTHEGKKLLAHELTHVLQQGNKNHSDAIQKLELADQVKQTLGPPYLRSLINDIEQASTPQERIRRIRILYERLAFFGRLSGYPLASDNMRFWLSNTDPAATKIIDSSYFLRDPNVLLAMQEMKSHIEDSLECNANGTINQRSQLVHSVRYTDLYYAIGDFTLRVSGTYSRIGNGNSIRINIQWVVNNEYNWHRGLGASILGVDIPDAYAAALEGHGATRYSMRSIWNESYTYTCKS